MPDITMINEAKKILKVKSKKSKVTESTIMDEPIEKVKKGVADKVNKKIKKDKGDGVKKKKLKKTTNGVHCDESFVANESVFIGLANDKSDNDKSDNDSAIEMSRSESRNRTNGKCVVSKEEEAERMKDQSDGAFENFPLSKLTCEKLKAKGITYLFPVQYKTFKQIHEGNDLIVQARTGTGKTMAFALPLVEKLQATPSQIKPPKVLVLAPTRELATQVCGDFESVSSKQLRIACIYGGVPYHPQERAVRRGLDIVVGTPGRILDIIDKGWLDLSQLQHVILDEVDRMLDMGFVDDVESIIRSAYENTTKPQTLLFSATLPVWVDRTASKYMTKGVQRIDLVGQQSIRTALSVTHLAMSCTYDQRSSVISDVITVYSGAHGRAMVFCEMKRDADALASNDDMKLPRHVLHGDITQARREFVLNDFKAGKCKVLITTDVAARGLDIPNVDLVIQCTPPRDIDSYIHRSGRTGRANRKGISILLYAPYEVQALHHVEIKSGIVFDRVPPPQRPEIIEAIGADARESLQKVTLDTIQSFRGQARALMKDMDAEDALAAALSVISGCERIASRSLLGSLKDHTTWELRSNQEIYSKAYVFSTLTKAMPEFDTGKLRDIRACVDRLAFVFDVPNSLNDFIRDSWVDTSYNALSVCETLPPIQQQAAPPMRNGNWGGGGGSRFGGRRGGGGFWGRSGGDGGAQRGRRGGRGRDNNNTFRYLKRSNRTADGPANNKRTKFN